MEEENIEVVNGELRRCSVNIYFLKKSFKKKNYSIVFPRNFERNMKISQQFKLISLNKKNIIKCCENSKFIIIIQTPNQKVTNDDEATKERARSFSLDRPEKMTAPGGEPTAETTN